MKIGEYKQMMSNLTRPGTPEQNKKAEENNKKYLADRKAKTLKEYGLDKPIENQPGYEIDKDPNLLRRIKMYSDNNLGAEFDKAIAEEDTGDLLHNRSLRRNGAHNISGSRRWVSSAG